MYKYYFFFKLSVKHKKNTKVKGEKRIALNSIVEKATLICWSLLHSHVLHLEWSVWSPIQVQRAGPSCLTSMAMTTVYCIVYNTNCFEVRQYPAQRLIYIFPYRY